MSELDRLRWQCRRGLLELDLLLNGFLDAHYANLNEMQIRAFKKLLEFPDQELLNLIMARAEPAPDGTNPVLQLLRNINYNEPKTSTHS
ncbi:MAG: succinate dehydrogenase assembly factor 2 [Burkholderiales bacterium]